MKIIISKNIKNKMIEELAEFSHSSWSGWMKYLFSKSTSDEDEREVIPKELVDRWKRQLGTDYKDLSEGEKESDRDEAKKILKIVNKYKGQTYE